MNQLTAPERSDLRRLEGVIERGLQEFIDIYTEKGAALKEIRDKKLFREKWKTFEAYCEDRFGIRRAHAYRLIESSEMRDKVSKMSPMGDKMNERQLRELAAVPEEALQQVLDKVVENHQETGDPITAKGIKEAAKQVVSEPVKAEPRKQDPSKLMSQIRQHNGCMIRAVEDLHRIKPDRHSKEAVLEYFRSIDGIMNTWGKA